MMRQAMPGAMPEKGLSNARTNATYATDVRVQDQGENPRVPNAAGAVDNPDSVPFERQQMIYEAVA